MRGIAKNLTLSAGFLGMSLMAQTLLDRQGNQLKNGPVKSGVSLPAICTQGDLYFLTTVPAGANLYGCTATNTWAAQGNLGGGGGSGALTIDSNGTVVGTRSVANFVPGTGILNLITDAGTMVNIQQGVDTAVIPTKVNLQSGATVLVTTTSASGTTYTGMGSPTFTAYSKDMVVTWDVGATPCAAGPITLNIDALGAKSVFQADGAANPVAGDCTANRIVRLAYDGAAFRIVGGGQTPIQAPSMATWVESARCNNSTAANLWDLPTINAPTPACYGTALRFGALDYADNANMTAFFKLPLPSGWTGNIDFTAKAFVNATSQSFKMTVATFCLKTNADILNPTFNPAQTISVTSPGTANQMFDFAQSNITSANCAAGDILVLQVGRDTADTSVATFSVTGAQITWRVTPQV